MTDHQEARLGGGHRLERRLDHIARYVRHATLPIFKPEGRRRPDLFGCSVALRRGSDFFLLTARHVVAGLKGEGFHIYTPADWIAANGEIARTDPKTRRTDAFDAAVIRLNTDVVNDHLRKYALTIGDLDIESPRPRNYLMQLVGYPGGEVLDVGNKTLSPTWFQWAGVSCDERAYAKRGRNSKFHSLFDFDRSKAIHSAKGRHPGPDMHGASGAGIWRMLPDGEDTLRERWGLLNAIFTEYEGRVITGTRVIVHIGLINKYFPG